LRQGIFNSISRLRASRGGTSTGQCQHLRGVRPDDGWSISGPVDHILDADRHVTVSSGHEWMTRVTGVGCSLGADELSRGRQGIFNSISRLRASRGGTSTGQCQHLRIAAARGAASSNTPWVLDPVGVGMSWRTRVVLDTLDVAAPAVIRSSNHGLGGLPVGSSGVDEYTVGNGGESLGFLGSRIWWRNL
jgi:hypothetical protein